MSTATLHPAFYAATPPPSHYYIPSTSKLAQAMGSTMAPDTVDVDGVGLLTYQRAIDIARNTEGRLDPNINTYLERAIRDIWDRINQLPESYLMTKDEFAVFNYYIRRFNGQQVAQQAVERYWRYASSMDGAAT